MAKKRQQYSNDFKFKIALEAVKAVKTVSQIAAEHNLHPTQIGNWKKQLLREGNTLFTRPNQVWSTDITYVPMQRGFMYLVAILDWHSRYVLSWEVSNTLEGDFCLLALERALQRGQPEIFNTDQGAQFTARAFTDRLEQADIKISMDGKGRVFDNIFIERLWRTVKYEHIYLSDDTTGLELIVGLAHYFDFYNHERFHQSLDYHTPAQVYGTNQVFLVQ